MIVKECVQVCINEGKTYEVKSAGEYASNLYVTAIKKHFGIDEYSDSSIEAAESLHSDKGYSLGTPEAQEAQEAFERKRGYKL
jgi:hypothetical protein